MKAAAAEQPLSVSLAWLQIADGKLNQGYKRKETT